jgi:hypothetical protein
MLIATTYGGGSAVAAPPSSARDSLKFTRLSVKDPGINNIEAVSFLIPAGWKVEGGMKWFLVYTNWQMGTLWSVHSAYSFRAPKGQLDRLTPMMNTTVSSARLSPEWYGGYMYVQKLFQDRMNQSIKNAAAISATITRNSEEIRKMYSESYRKRSESQDRISQSFSEYIRGVETYKNPYEGRPVQLPSGYSDAWVNARGEYLLSNNAGFNPNVGDTTEWRRMDRRDPRGQ